MVLLTALLLASIPQDAVEVPFHMGDNAIIVEATVNNKKLSLMFDSGFSGTVVVDQNIELGPPSGEITLRDFVGEFHAHTVKIKTLKLGSMSIDTSEMEAVEQPVGRDSFSYNAHVDGILGLQAIMNNVTEINFQNQKFILHPKTFDITKRVPDNKTTFLVKMLPLGVNSVELPVYTPDGKRMILALDTGNAFYATTHKDVLERVGLWDSNRTPKFAKGSMVASGAVESWEKQLKDMKVFDVPVPTSYWDVIDLPASSAEGDGTIGIRFLKNFNVTIDYERRRVWLENFTGQAGNQPKGEVGLLAAADRSLGYVKVYRVTPGSPGAKAGIQAEDEILSINGQELRPSITYRQVEALLNGEPGTKIDIAISRAGQLMRFQLERVAMFNE